MIRVLVVDDSPTELAVMKQYIEQAGYETMTADGGQAGIDLAISEKPDVIFMDIVMPGINGYRAMRSLRQNSETASIPIVVVSSKKEEADIEWAKRKGANAYIVKPVREDVLFATLEEVLAGSPTESDADEVEAIDSLMDGVDIDEEVRDE